MKNLVFKNLVSVASSVSAAVIFIGCGGSGGEPAPSPQPVIPAPDPVVVPIVPADPFATQEYLANPALALAGASAAYTEGYTGAGVRVAVIDTGVNASHSELAANLSRSDIYEKAVKYTYTGDANYAVGGVVGWQGQYVEISGDQISRVSYSIANPNQIYAVAPTVTITGDGTGATAEVLLGTDGKIKTVVMTNNGSGYTNATATITDASGNAVVTKTFLGGQDEYGHGTFVSTVIGAQKDNIGMHGIAFNSTMMAIKASPTDGGNGIGMGLVLDGLEWARLKGAKVVNQSFGSNATVAYNSNIGNYALALQDNVSIVSAAGNNGSQCTTINSGNNSTDCFMPAASPWDPAMSSHNLLANNGAWIVVGALDESGSNIASYSNRAGLTKSNYILAPGTNLGGNIAGGLEMGQGTSFAAPIVSGSMAMMYEKWPALTGREMSEILFKTADDLGAAGVDDIYGNGKLNLNKAFSPIGVLSVPTSPASVNGSVSISSASNTALTNTKMTTSAAFGMSLQSFEPINNTIALDSYQRDFKVGMASAVQSTGVNTVDFDQFAKSRYKKLIVGANTLTGEGAIGWQVNRGTSIMASYSHDLIGASGSGALGFGNAKSYYLNAKKIFESDDVRVEGQLTYGYGEADPAEGSLITNISAVQAVGGLAKASYNGFGLGYAVPLRVVSGAMDFSIPVSRTVDGLVNYENAKAALSPDALEQKASLFYEARGDLMNFSISAEHTFDKFNIAGLSDDEVSVSLYYYF